MGRKAARQLPELPPLPEIEAGDVAGHAWLMAMDRLAGDGDERAAAALQESRTRRPDLWDRHRENPADHALAGWVQMFGSDGPGSAYTRTAIRHDAERLREELLDGSADALDRVMVDRIVAAHLQAAYYDAFIPQAMKAGAGAQTLDHYTARATAAHRQFARACESFARVRRLRGPAVAVSIGAVNVGALAGGPAAALPERDAAGEGEAIEAAYREAAPVRRG